jgi:hypothetical protein
LRIWNLNLPGARIVPIYCGSDLSLQTDSPTRPSTSSALSISSSSSQPPGCSSSALIPANLHACSESRNHALATRYSHSLAFARSPNGRVILDHDLDVLYFPPAPGYMAAPAQFHTCMSLCDPADLRRIRRVALHEDIFSGHLRQQPQKGGGGYYWSALAVGLTTECLRLVRDRMPAVDEIIIVSAAGSRDQEVLQEDMELEYSERLAAQVQTAMKDLSETADMPWNPHWDIAIDPIS